MATSSVSNVASSVDLLSAVERSIVVRALELSLASTKRAVNAERNPEVRDIRAKDLASIEALIVKFR